jgi:putative flippase GtrA
MMPRPSLGRGSEYGLPFMRRLRELGRYGVVGVFNAATYVVLYAALVLAGVPYVLSAVVAFPVPVAVGYWLHEHWTFGRGRPSGRGLAGFLAIQLAALGLDIAILVVLVDSLGMRPIAARLVSTPLGSAFSYLTSRAWIFGRRARRRAVPES